jgi:hypothetical protein
MLCICIYFGIYFGVNRNKVLMELSYIPPGKDALAKKIRIGERLNLLALIKLYLPNLEDTSLHSSFLHLYCQLCTWTMLNFFQDG